MTHNYICRRGEEIQSDYELTSCPKCGEQLYIVPPDADETLPVRPKWYIKQLPSECILCGGKGFIGDVPCAHRVGGKVGQC